MVTAYIGLGANLNQPIQQLQTAITQLCNHDDVTVTGVSSFYRNPPMGPQDQPDYVNAVLALETSLAPLSLLDLLQQIEQQQGRVRKAEQWGPRTLDLDILLYGNQQIDQARLTVPHYGLKERIFVVLPLAEIAGELRLPCGTLVSDLILNFDPTLLVKIPMQSK